MTLHTKQHASILTDILRDIYEDKKIGLHLGFKGGTAAMLFYGLPRFSVDLDFDLLDPTEAKTVLNRMTEILEKYGTIKKVHSGHNGISFTLAYDSKAPRLESRGFCIRLSNH